MSADSAPTLSTGAWVLMAPRATHTTLRPLIQAHEQRRAVRVITCEQAPSQAQLEEWLHAAAGGLLIADRRRAPRTLLPGPFLCVAQQRVPVGLLPYTNLSDLERVARTSAQVLRRRGMRGPLALLGQWEMRYLQLVTRMVVNLEKELPAPIPILRWTADRITRDALLDGLEAGVGMAIYFGHGRPNGWAAYHGLRDHHFNTWNGQALGALLSVTCYTASRWRMGLSFSEQMVLRGVAASAFGAVAPIQHLDNMRWMIGLVGALQQGAATLGEALCLAAPAEPSAHKLYRILGDPLAPLVGSGGSEKHSRRIYAPAPEELTG